MIAKSIATFANCFVTSATIELAALKEGLLKNIFHCQWIQEYNKERPHSGRHCYGKTPMQMFIESKHIAQAKMLGE